MDITDAKTPTTNPIWIAIVSSVIEGIVTQIVFPLVVGIISKYVGINAFSSVITIVIQWTHHFFGSTTVKKLMQAVAKEQQPRLSRYGLLFEMSNVMQVLDKCLKKLTKGDIDATQHSTIS